MSSTKVNYLFNLLLTVVSLIFPILSFPYAARILDPVGIGKVQFIISFTQYFAMISALGIPMYGIREIAKAQKNRNELDKTFSELIIIYFFTSILLTAIYLVVVTFIDKFSYDRNLYYLATGIILLGFCSIDWFYSGIEQFKTIAIRSVSIKVISLVLLYAFVKTKHDVAIYLAISIFALLGNNVISIILVWKRVSIVLTNLNFKRHWKPLFYIFSTSVAASMYTILDVIILGLLSDSKAVGYYSAGVKLSKFSIPFVTSLGAVVMPKISNNLKEEKMDLFYSVLNKSFEFIIFISLPISIGLFLMSKEALLLFSGEKFLPGEGVMKILSFLPFIIGLGYFFGIQILIASGKDKQLLISVSIGMVISVLLNFLLIPFMKENGAALANLISEIFVTATYMYFVNKLFDFKINYKIFSHSLLSSLLFIPITLLIRHVVANVVLEVLITILACSVIYMVMQLYVFKNLIATNILNAVTNILKGII